MKLLAALAMMLVTAIGWSSAQAQDQHGAIAFSKEANGGYKWGLSWNHEGRAEARNRAIQECRSKGGRNCGEILWFRNTCGALAVGGGNGYGTGWGESVAVAERSAISECREVNASCRIEASRCSKPAPVVSTEPKCAGMHEGAQCWKELVNRSGCYWWDNYYVSDQTLTWSGECSRGVAEGRGTLSYEGPSNDYTGEASGLVANGLQQGRWVERVANGDFYEGSYIDGKEQGPWVLHFADGQIERGDYSFGERTGNWDTYTAVRTYEDRYGSIAFQQLSGGGYAWGIAWSYNSWDSARNRAKQECRGTGSRSCTEVGWFRNACGALAIGDENGYGTGWGDSIAAAERSAMSNCRAANQNCRVEEARCAEGSTVVAKREEPKREVTEPKQREQLTPKCREYLASVDRLFELQRRYARAAYDGGETYSFTSGMQAEYERLEAIATSLGADFQTAFYAAQGVWIEKGAGSTAAEAKSKTQGAIDASRATFLKEGGVCQS